jgi:hypothetical protein
MFKKFSVLVFSLCCFLFLAGSSIVLAADNEVSQKDIETVVKALKGLKFESLLYLSYQSGQENNGTDFSRFALKRGYLTIKKDIMPWFSTRFTADITQVKDEAKDSNNKVYSNYDGSVAVRMKYLYGLFNLPDNAFLTKPNIEVGLVHMPWIDFEEKVNFYRLQDTMFLERNSIFDSADTGITFSSLIGGTIDDNYQKSVNNSYPGRYGSMSFGIYNGGGYHASEKNTNKVFEGRLTIRPLPDIIPGLQFSYFGTVGKGNQATNPEWSTNLLFVSFEHKYLTLTGQYYTGKGNQGGSDEKEKKGHSVFAEIKPMDKFSIIGRYDHFDPDKNSANDENDRYIVGLAYMLDKPHNNMILIDYDTVNYKQTGKKDDNRVQLTLQISF